MSGITLADLAPASRWVAWQSEPRADGKPTKVPRDPATGRKASATNPATWRTKHEAIACAALLPRPCGDGGVGLVLGAAGEVALCGADLDTCRDLDGKLRPWAQEVVDRLGTYAETSPSQSGVKAFFTADPADVATLRKECLAGKQGRSFKAAGSNGAEHPPAIELYVGERYFAVTEQHLPGTPTELRPVSLETLKWLVEAAGPDFAGKAKPGAIAKQRSDASRSAIAFRKGCELRRAGKTYEEMVEALSTDPETAAWVEDKGRADGERELRRIWDKAGEDDPVAAVVAEFNDRYILANEAGQAVILQPRDDPAMHRRVYDRLRPPDLKLFYANRKVQVGTDKEGRAVSKNAANVWLEHPDRRQYINGIVFDPSGGEQPPGVLNLWTGFQVKPAPGDWSLMRAHIADIICDRNDAVADYVFKWLALMFQRPAEQGEVAIVMQGKKGCGKGTVARALRTIIGQHAMQVSNGKHLVGAFNAHLRDLVFLFADEALFAGDKQHIGVLQSLITEDTLVIEAKGLNAISARNRLHVMMASNERWVVQATQDERRYCVLEAGDGVVGNHEYFAAIDRQMESGGYAAMLHDLLAMDLSGFNVRAVPKTIGLANQQKQSAETHVAWWQDCLERGYVFGSKLGLEQHFAVWTEHVTTELLFKSYSEFAKARGERRPLTREWLGRFLCEFVKATAARRRSVPVGEHRADVPNPYGGTNLKAEVVLSERGCGYIVGTLDDARKAFCKATGWAIAWD